MQIKVTPLKISYVIGSPLVSMHVVSSPLESRLMKGQVFQDSEETGSLREALLNVIFTEVLLSVGIINISMDHVQEKHLFLLNSMK